MDKPRSLGLFYAVAAQISETPWTSYGDAVGEDFYRLGQAHPHHQQEFAQL